MILDKIEEQHCVVCAMEDEHPERDREDLGHDGGDEHKPAAVAGAEIRDPARTGFEEPARSASGLARKFK
eukprot:13812719-Heterocapsa_arctica.AAC.1